LTKGSIDVNIKTKNMPSGFTSDIYNGKKITLKDFALKCARAFGACIHLRDDPMDVSFDISSMLRKSDVSYHKGKIEEAKKIKKPTKLQFKKSILDKKIYYKEQIEKSSQLKSAYEKMLNEVISWEPPSKEHENFKEFMIDQLKSSIDHDCQIDFYKRSLDDIESITYREYCRELKDSAAKSIKYHSESMRKEIENAEAANLWIKQLFESLN
jgi:hypothetical protein